MAWIAEQLLRDIGRHAPKACITKDRLVELTGLTAKQVENALLKLRKHGLVERTETGGHCLTSAGQQALAAGETKLKSGPRGPQPGARIHRGSLRTRVWRAIRIRRKFSLPEIETLVVQGEEKAVRNNIGKYLKALERAGYLVRMPRREAGEAPTSNGHLRYWLPDNKDTGPIAPIWRPAQGTLFDQNIGKEVALCGENS
ncbi:hypothetical protein [Nitrosomonas halophila]|uniref:Uncharacterized protein n=1 Tax=Nitrosomonas halophila TaxID=44576 RepID=A0A1H3FFA6_9PROT|nr:hypothetical protein [Nitrosomonas halophila]SDX89447.1 hypothetical protein SAMN05421881_101172 [Nitrosomonas halophila]